MEESTCTKYHSINQYALTLSISLFDSIPILRKIKGVTDGECTFAVAALATWELLQLDSSVHGDCNMEWIGRVVSFQQAGLALKTDAGIKCTSLIQDVLHLHLVEMKADGFLEKAWNDEMRRSQDINCAAIENAAAKDDEFVTLTMRELAGPFVFHAGFTALAFVAAFAMMCRRRHVSTKQKSSSRHIPNHVMTNNHEVPHRVMAKHVKIFNAGPGKGPETPASSYRHSGKTMDETDMGIDEGDYLPQIRSVNSGSVKQPVKAYPQSGEVLNGHAPVVFRDEMTNIRIDNGDDLPVHPPHKSVNGTTHPPHKSVNGAIDQMCANIQLNDISHQMSTMMSMIREQKSMIEGQRVMLERQNDDIKILKQSKQASPLSKKTHGPFADC